MLCVGGLRELERTVLRQDARELVVGEVVFVRPFPLNRQAILLLSGVLEVPHRIVCPPGLILEFPQGQRRRQLLSRHHSVHHALPRLSNHVSRHFNITRADYLR